MSQFNKKKTIMSFLLLFVQPDDDGVPNDSCEEESQEDEETNPPEDSFPFFDSKVAKNDDAEEKPDHRTSEVSGVTNLKRKKNF